LFNLCAFKSLQSPSPDAWLSRSVAVFPSNHSLHKPLHTIDPKPWALNPGL